jgi:A/G-specific adenine glycosylase
MLTQTQVSRVAVRFQPFIERFGTSKRCSSAELSSVLQAWSGLGYNRRAKSLHDAARRIESQFSGRVPSALADLGSLNGVGPYVSRAVAAFAFAEHVAPIDSNVRRVLERALAGEPLSLTRAQKIGDALIPRGRAREWGLALMDFGSLVCTSRAPKCLECPVRARHACTWRGSTDRTSEDAVDPRTRMSQTREVFGGSNREIRGRLLRAACDAPIPAEALVVFESVGADAGRALELATRLVGEGLLVVGARGEFRLA